MIDRTLRGFTAGGPKLVGAAPEAKALLDRARQLATQEEHAPPMHEEGHGFVDLLERIGRTAHHMWDEALETLSFLGATLIAISTVVWRPAKMRWTALVSVMEDAGLDAVPIVTFLSFFVGMVVAFIGAATLAQFGATIFVVELVGFGVLRELGGVLVAIIIAGRTNSAFTAQIGAMKMRQKVDAMQTLGLGLMHVIVAPRVLSMMIMVPVLPELGIFADYELASKLSILRLQGETAMCEMVVSLIATDDRSLVARADITSEKRADSDKAKDRALALKEAAYDCATQASQFAIDKLPG